MPRLNSANNAETTIVASLGTTDTSFTVADASSFPDAPFRVSIDGEIMEVGAIDRPTNTFSSVLRGQEGTAAANHTGGASIQNRFTAGTYAELESSASAQQKADQAESDAIQSAEDYVNSFGIGDTPPLLEAIDLNNLRWEQGYRTGFYRVTSTSTNLPVDGFGYVVQVMSDDTGQTIQIAYTHSVNGKIFTRRYAAGAWSEWKEVVNEDYVILGNGRTLQTISTETINIAANSEVSHTITYPIALTGSTNVQISPRSSGAYANVYFVIASTGQTSSTIKIYNTAPSSRYTIIDFWVLGKV